MPVTGMIPMVIPMFTKTWKRKMVETPTAIRTPNRSREMVATWRMRQTSRKKSKRSTMLPTKPTLSARLEKMKSVWSSGRKPRFASVWASRPLPVIPPEPIAILDCATW
jgi:hypothetical protein